MNLSIVLVSLGVALAASGAQAELAPFVLPWNDASAGATDLSAMNRAIQVGQRVSVDAKGRFVAGGDRVRFLGVNFAGDSPFMPTNKADAVAARLAKFGINCARFHHMDAPWATGGGILSYTGTSSRNLNAAQLERVQVLVSRLAAHGIYSDINLLVGREYRLGDGLGPEVVTMDWKDSHVLGFFDETALGLQKEFATRLLTPVSSSTGRSLAQEPGVAFVEILNENGILQKWLDGGLDRLPDRYAQKLQNRWNAWLTARYASEDELVAAWKPVTHPLSTNLLKNGDFGTTLASWNPEQHDTAKASFVRTLDFTGGKPSVRIQVTTAGSQNWHVQFNQAHLRVTQDQVYTLTFSAKASVAGVPLAIAVMQGHEPWQSVSTARSFLLDTGWQRFTNTVVVTRTDANARLNFNGFGDRVATVWLADVRLQSGGAMGNLPEGTSLAGRNIPKVRLSGDGFLGTTDARKDWLRFLRDLEVGYYDAMVAHLRTHCGYAGLIFGTITANSPASVQSRLDVVDAHAYWQHPQFPGQAWDSVNWTISNTSLANTVGSDNTLSGLARQRIKGKPFTVTEYQHPSPNPYSAEGPLLLAAYAALQDWDGLWLFDYGAGQDSVPMGQIRGFFDTGQHPLKMANLLVAANLFRRGDVARAVEEVTVALTLETEINLLQRDASAWSIFSGAQLGLPTRLPLISRVSTEVGANAAGSGEPLTDPLGNVLTADTGELTWDVPTTGKGYVTINTARTKALIGFTDDREVNLGGVRLHPGRTELGFSTLALTLMRGGSLTNGGTAVLVAAGQCENTEMQWKDATRTSVGNHWGTAPTLIEVVPFSLTLPVAKDRVQVWALSPTGQRQAALEVKDAGPGASQITHSPAGATLWYEIRVAPLAAGFEP